MIFSALVLTACGGTSASNSTTVPLSTASTTLLPTPTTSTTTPATTSVPPDITTTSVADEAVILLPSASDFGPGWEQILFVPYGAAEDQLGTASGGENLELGPEYGTQASDGSWWFLDAAKRRLAQYSAAGEYLGAVAMKPEHLVGPQQYFQYQLPHMLEDGTLVMVRHGEDSATLLLLQDEAFQAVTVPSSFSPRVDDGSWLYGFAGEDQHLAKVNPRTGTPEPVEWFLTRAGTRFRMEVRDDQLTVDLPDAEANQQIAYRMSPAADPAVPAYFMVEVATGQNGTLFVYILGGTDSGVGGQLAGFLEIRRDGVASPVESTRDPFTPSDPGSPAHLGVRPGTSTPWIMIVDTDGVRVYGRV
jgi:hypothetical protein